MRVRLGTLRRYLHEALLAEVWPGQPYGRNTLSPDINNREQIGALTAKALDTVDDPDGLPDHLKEPLVSREDCEGPVPPTAEPVTIHSDPFARDFSPAPTAGINR